MGDDAIKVLLLNIFPGGKNVLHYAYKNLKVIRKIFTKILDINSKTDNEKF